ncbi:MAG: DEAD/DEAH box helicase [Verrucomicrobiales bacterium]
MSFAELGLSEPVLRAVEAVGYQKPTPIQEKAIPVILAGRDVLGSSQTGTGKTAAFALPTLSRLGEPQKKVRCLVLEPTRELASQVDEEFSRLGQFTGLGSVVVYGGVGYGKQLDGLKAGGEIVIATPGRLLDHLSRRTISLEALEVLVLDEVDRMLDMGFLPDVRKIVDKCPKDRQTLFFSATLPPQLKTLANWAVRDPFEIEIGRRLSAAETVSHYFYPVALDQRDALLMALLERTDFRSVMIFTRTKMQADRLFAELNRKGEYNCTVMHSDIRQSDREKALKGFRSGEFDIIIATDIAARGLDISGVSHVINFQVPENPEDYVHRIGRTGRAEKEGDAFTILCADELDSATSIERTIGQKVERRRLEGFPYNYTTLLDADAPSPEKFNRLVGRRKPGKRRRR